MDYFMEEFIKTDDFSGTDVEVYARYIKATGDSASKTAFTRRLNKIGIKRVSRRVGGKVVKMYKNVGLSGVPCPYCHGKGTIQRAV